MHAQISGTVDFREPNDEACIERLRSLVDKMGHHAEAPFDHKPSENPKFPAEEIYGVFTNAPGKQYDMRDVIARAELAARWIEDCPEHGRDRFSGYAHRRIYCRIVANQKCM